MRAIGFFFFFFFTLTVFPKLHLTCRQLGTWC